MRKPTVFIGSSKETLRVAQTLANQLEEVARTTVWDEDIFELTHYSFESLSAQIDEFDFAVLIFSGDDITITRGKERHSVRDNVVLERGLFLGRLGRNRTFVVRDRKSDANLPSDLLGVTYAEYDSERFAENRDAATRRAFLLIAEAIENAGRRSDRRVEPPLGVKSTVYAGFKDECDAPDFRRGYRFVGYLAQFVERRIIEAGGKKQLVTPPVVDRFAGAGLKSAEGTWQLVWDADGIYLNASTETGSHPLTSRCAVPNDWPQYSSWDYAGKIADELLTQLEEGASLVSR